ncbi:hypothetical protein LguiA_017768 [Lonicera macranthoides]
MTTSSFHSSSIDRRDPKYARIRRRIDFTRRSEEESPISVIKAGGIFEKCEIVVEKMSVFTGLAGFRLKIRRQMAFTVADHISKLNSRLRICNLLDYLDFIESLKQESDNLPSKSLKNSALILSLILLSLPFLFFKYVDRVSKSRRLSDINGEEVSLNKQLAYKVDVFLSVHPYAKPLTLIVATLLLILLGGLALFGVTDDSLAYCLWLSWTYVADSGNHMNSEGISPRLVSVSISFGRMLIFAMMLGLVSDAISEKFDSLRKGRSEVVKQNHTLILGWGDKLVSVSKVRAIIVLAEEGNTDQSDARALRTVLSLTGVKEGLRGHIVTYSAHDVIGRLMIQCARQPGLAQIWEDILGFENCEFYIKRWPQLDRMQFDDVLISFPDAIPCGVKAASCGGKIILNPDDSYVLQEGNESRPRTENPASPEGSKVLVHVSSRWGVVQGLGSPSRSFGDNPRDGHFPGDNTPNS